MLDHTDSDYPANKSFQDIDFASILAFPDSKVWELIFDSLPDMVALIDLDNVVVKANKAMLLKLKIGDKSLVGNKCHNLLHDRGCAIENCPHIRMIEDQKPHSIELFEPKINSYLHISTTPVFDSNNNLLGSLHIVRDITTQKESEAKLNEFNAELKELNFNKDKFFSIVAHDLRSPFQGMLGFTELILDEIDTLSNAEIKEYVQKVHDSSYSTFTLLENLLNWSRLQTGRMQINPVEFNIREEVKLIISLLAANAQSKNVYFNNEIAPYLNVNADQQMIHSILLNLTTNAIKFSFPGGRISFNAKIVDMDEDSSEKTSLSGRYCLEISVSDNGVGMSAEVLSKLFAVESHFSLAGTANEQGSGLGLIIVKEMTEKQGGKLQISSETNKGSVFSFTIPLAQNGNK
jgi:PAS domain S-box-containing protein